MDLQTQVQHYLEQLENDVTLISASARLSQFFENGSIGDLIDQYESRAAEHGASAESARFLVEAGALALTRLKDSEQSGVLLDQASSAGADSVVFPEARLLLLANAGDVEALYAYFGEALESVDEAGQSRLYFRMGELLEFLFEDIAESQNAYNYALELDPGNMAAYWGRQRTAKKAEEWADYAELLYNEIQVTEDTPRQLDALLELGDVYLQHLDQAEGAAQCYATVFEYDAANTRARAALESLGYELPPLDGADESAEAEEAPAEDLAEESDADEAELSEDSDMESEVDEADEDEDAEELEADVDSAEEESDAEEVAEDDESDEELDADDLEEDESSEVSEAAEDEVEDDYEDVAEEAAATPAASGGDWRARFESYLSAGDETSLLRAAALQSRHNSGDADALKVFEAAAAAGLYEQVHFLYEGDGFWNTAVDVVSDDKIKTHIQLVHLHDADAAAATGGDAELLEDLEAGQANWRKMQRALEGRYGDLGKDEQALHTYMRMADLAHALHDSDKEMDALRRLDRQLKDDLTVKRRLKLIYRDSEKWPMYVDIVKAEAAEIEDDLAEKIDLLNEMVVVYRDHMNHDMMVVNTYKEILDLQPENAEAVDALIELYDKLNRSSELIAMLQTKAELASTDEARVEIHAHIARLFLERFRNQAEAIKAYEQVLEIDSHNAEAIEFLKEMYEKRRDWEKLIDVHKLEIETLDGDEAKAAALKDVAQLATDKLRKGDAAAQLWLEVRQYAPADPDALDALEKIYEKAKDFEKLAEVLQSRAEQIDGDELMKLLAKLAPIYSDRLDNVEGAVATWKRALEIAPDDLKARKSLERLYIDNEQWDELEDFYKSNDAYPDLVRLLETLSNTAKDDNIKIELLVRAARIWRVELEDTSRAERDLDKVLQIDPRNELAALQLEPIYDAAEDYERLKDVCEVILSHKDTPEAKRHYQLKLAQLHEGPLKAVDGAFAWYAQAYAEIPDLDDVVEPLERTAGQAGQWESLVGVYENVLDRNLDPDTARETRLRLGRVLSKELEQLDEALAHFQQVLSEDAENQTALRATADIYERSQQWDELLAVYQRQIELTDAPEDRVKILSGMALIAENQAGDVPSAIEKHNEALEIDPNYEPSLRELHRLYRGEAEYEKLADVIRREIDIVEGRAIARPATVTDTVDYVALMQGAPVEPELDDEFEAPAPESAFEDSDADVESDHGLDEVSSDVEGAEDSLDSEASDAEDADEDIDAEADSEVEESEADEDLEEGTAAEADDEPAAAASDAPVYDDDDLDLLVQLRYELGVICKEFLSLDGEAVASLGAVLQWRPNHAEARQTIESYLDSSEHQYAVAQVLEPAYEVSGAWTALIQVLEIQAQHAPSEAVGLLERAGQVHLEELGDPASSFEAYGRVLALDPSHEGARSQLRRIADALDYWQNLVELYGAIAPDVSDDQLRLSYHYEMGDIYADRLHQAADAQANYEAVLEIDSANSAALDDLESLLVQTQQWDGLRSVLQRQLGLADSQEATEALQFKSALLHEEKLGEPSTAIETYNSILESNPTNRDALAALNRLLASEGRWEDLAASLERELELATDANRNEVKNRFAQVLEQHLKEYDRAVDLYESVLAEEPHNEFTLGAMQNLMYEEGAPRGRASKILEPIYLELDAWEHVIAALEVQVDTEEEDYDRVTLLHRIAALYEARGQDQPSAFATFARALHYGVDNEQTLQAMYRLAAAIDGYAYLVQAFEEEAAAQEDPAVKRDLLRRAATVYRDAMSDESSATQRLHEVLELFPSDLETVEELEAIYRATQNWSSLVTILVQKSELVEQLDDKKHLLQQAGTMYEEFLERPEDAIDVHNRVLELDGEDGNSIDRLEVLYRELEMWDELLGIYNRKVGLAGSDGERKDLYYAMGAIYRQALGQPHDAIEVFRKVLEIEAGELAAWVQLDELYEETEQWPELLETLEAELMLTPMPEDAHQIKYRMGQLYEGQLFEIPKAIETYAAVLAEDAGHAETTAALESLIERGEHEAMAAEVLVPIYQNAGEWEKLIHVYRLLISATENRERSLEIYSQIGAIYEYQMEDTHSAFETFSEALGVDASQAPVLDTLERLAGQLGRWEDYIERLDTVIADISDFGVVRNLHVRVARVNEVEQGEAAGAIERFNRVLELEPSDEEAIASLDRLYQTEGRWEDLADILRTRILNEEEPDAQLELRLRLGLLFQTALEDENEALAVYQNILAEDAENPQAIQSLEQMFMAGQAVQQVAAILEPFYSSRDQHAKLIEIYLQRREMLEDPIERFDVSMLIARTFLDELGEAESALALYGQALSEKPDEEQVIEKIEMLAEQTGNWPAGAQLLIDALDSPQIDEESSIGIYLALARIFDQRMGEIDQAENAYLNVLALDEGHAEALGALDRIYENQGRWEDLSAILIRRIETVYDEDEIVSLNYRLAQLYQNHLGELSSAVDTYQTILDIQPTHIASLKMLEQIFFQQQQWADLYDVLERQSEITDEPDDQSRLFAQMAQIAEEMLDRAPDAVDLWNRVLQIDPNDMAALQNLRRLYLTEERWQDLVTVLEREVELTPIPEDQLTLYESLGTIFSEKLQNDGQALEAWQNVLRIHPVYLPALEALRDLHARAGEYAELAEIIHRLIDHDGVEPEHKFGLWVEVGQIHGDMLMEPDKAIHAWKNVLTYQPGHAEALDSLERMFTQEARWEDAAEILEMKLDTIEDFEDRIELLLRIADLWENKIVDRDQAARFYEQVMAYAPTHEQAGASLEQIYREQGTVEAYQALATLYLDRADNQADDPEAFLNSRRASARVFEENLQQMEGAFLVLVTAFRPDTIDDETLLVDLERFAAETGQWADLAAEVEKVLNEVGDTPDAADLHRKVGAWQATHLNQPDEAIYHLQRALTIEPDNVEVMAHLEDLYRQIGAWPELGQILRMRVEATLDPDEQIELWRKLGELYEMQMGQIDDAIESYQAILNIDPADILAIESLERIYEAYDRWNALIEILSQKAEATYDPEAIVDIRYRIAGIWEERLGDVAEAINTYQQVLEVDQSHTGALQELERLFVSTQDWDQLLGVYEQQLTLTHEPDEQVTIYSKMATLHEDQFEDVDRAIEALNNIMTVTPDNLHAIENLERLYIGQENWFDLAEVFQRHSEVVTDPSQQAAVLTQLGRVQRDQINDPNAAIEAFVRSLQAVHEQPEVWSEIAVLYDETANWHASIEALHHLVDLTPSPEAQIETLHRIGFLHEANLQDDVSAEEVYQRALTLVSDHEPVILALRDLYTRRADWQGVIRTLKHAEEVARDLVKKSEYTCQIGNVYNREMNDPVSAVHYFEQALENDPENLDAAAPLIDHYMSEQRWERAFPLLQKIIASRTPDSDQEEMHRRSVQMARVSMELGQEEAALNAFREAYEIDPTDVETLKGMSELLYRREEWEQAFKIFQTLQFNHADSLGNNEAVDIYFKSGEIKNRIGERQSAIQMFNKALEYEPNHLPSLNALVTAYEETNNWGEVVNTLQFLINAEQQDTVKFAHLARIGDIWMENLGDPGSAIRSYLEALDVDPNSVVILRKLLDIYTKTSQWTEAVEILNQLIEQEQDIGRRSKYLYTVAVIYRDEIGDLNASVEKFDETLDADVKMLKAFEAIDRILTTEKSWKELERAYRRMLRRVTENDDGEMEGIKILLWQNLGEIYRSRLGHVKSAIQAYEAAVGLRPDDEKLRLILAELYERSEDNPDGAIQQHKELIKLDPFRIESYRALWKSYMQKKEYDMAWCMAGALSFLQNANEQEEKFYQQYLGQNLRLAKGQLNQELWKLVYHEEQDMLMSHVMAILAQGLRPYYARPLKEWGVHKKKDILSPDEQLMFCKVFSYAARAEGLMPAPTLYLKRDQALGMRNANSDPPAFIVGGDMMQGKGDRELAFTVGKQVALARPEHYLATTPYPTEILKIFFMAAMHITDTSLGIGQTLGDEGGVVIKEIQRMPGPMLMQLQKTMKTYLQTGKNPNLSQWLISVDNTSSRLGLLLCGDLHQAASAIKNDMNPIGKASVKEKIRDLVLFAISDEYFTLRKQLGLSIENR